MQTKAHHNRLQNRNRLETEVEGPLQKKGPLFFKRSFRQDERTNQRGNENDGAQAGERSCWAWHFGHEPSILGKEMNI